MDQEKIGKFIKKLRKENNLTQNDLAKKYNVTYQAVSKWENGKSIPDITLLKAMSKDFNISLDSLIDGEVKKTSSKRKYLFVIIPIIILIILSILYIYPNKSTYEFKTISTTCADFKITGVIAFNQNKSSIYISNVDYCGGDDLDVYTKIECTLYEKNNNIEANISSYINEEDKTLIEYLKDLSFKIDYYNTMCKNKSESNFYLNISLYDKNNKITYYNVPLDIIDDCEE